MQDMYEYSNRREDVPQVKYISTNRQMSEETLKRIMDEEGITSLDHYDEQARAWGRDKVYRRFRVLNLANI